MKHFGHFPFCGLFLRSKLENGLFMRIALVSQNKKGGNFASRVRVYKPGRLKNHRRNNDETNQLCPSLFQETTQDRSMKKEHSQIV